MPDSPPFVCPVCGRTSYNPNDRKEGWCGNCQDYTAPTLEQVSWLLDDDLKPDEDPKRFDAYGFSIQSDND